MLKWFGLTGLVLWLAGTVTVLAAMSWDVVSEPVPLYLADGTPVGATLYRARNARADMPAAVVVHGTALAHPSCVPGLAIPLARNGYLTLAVDLLGHGHSGGRLPKTDLDYPLTMLNRRADHPEIDAAIDYLKGHPLFVRQHVIAVREGDVQHVRAIERVALVGHSRGGWAVTNVGYRRPDVDSVVSIGAAPATCDVDRPHNLLILTGGQEELCPMSKCIEAIARATGGAVQGPSTAFGEFWAGTARRLLLVSGVNHFAELGDPSVARCVVQWFGSSLDIDAGPVNGGWLALLVTAIVVATGGGLLACTWILVGLGRRLPRLPASIAQPWPLRRLLLWGAVLAGTVPAVAAIAPWIEVGPAYFAGPTVALLGATALGCFGVAFVGRWDAEDWKRAFGWKGVGLGLLSFGLALAGLGLPWGNSWMELMPNRQRFLLGLVLVPLLFPGSLGLAIGLPRLVGGPAESKRTRLVQGLIWLGAAVTLWGGFVFFAADRWPLFTVPAGFLSASMVGPLPLWLAPNRQGMAVARALSHTGTAAWLLACHLPFVQG